MPKKKKKLIIFFFPDDFGLTSPIKINAETISDKKKRHIDHIYPSYRGTRPSSQEPCKKREKIVLPSAVVYMPVFFFFFFLPLDRGAGSYNTFLAHASQPWKGVVFCFGWPVVAVARITRASKVSPGSFCDLKLKCEPFVHL